MKIADVSILSKMTNIEIDEDIYQKFESSVKDIMVFCDILNKVDVSNIKPLFSVFELYGVNLSNLRQDKVEDGNYIELLLKNVPDKEDVFICVPKVIE